MPETILFVPETARAALARMEAALPGSRWMVERQGMLRSPTSAIVEIDGVRTVLDALGAFYVDGPHGEALEGASGGWLRGGDASPLLRGLALCALVGRVRAEGDADYEGRADEPRRLLEWLERHGADIALSEEERGWLREPIGSLPDEVAFMSLPERLASHAYALGILDSPDPLPEARLPALLNEFGFLQSELPDWTSRAKLRPGREAFLG